MSAPLFALLACKRSDETNGAGETLSATAAPAPMPTLEMSSPFGIGDVLGDASDPENPLFLLSHLDASELNALMAEGGPVEQAMSGRGDAGFRAKPQRRRDP
ncbi:MAG TPA: hypothetical protein VGH28_01620 [Polyangiaceae bacterium]